MTDLRTAAQQALEALEASRRSHYYCEDTWYSCPKHEDGCANEMEGDECNCGADEANEKIDQSITALRAALAQQAEPFTPDAIRTTQTAWKMGYDAAKAETQPAEPQTTHSAECWRWHHRCAVAKIERECKHD